MAGVIVHPRVRNRHPDVEEADVIAAWTRLLCMTRRTGGYDDNYMAVGFDLRGRLLEMVAVCDCDDTWIVFHAMPATEKALKELGLR